MLEPRGEKPQSPKTHSVAQMAAVVLTAVASHLTQESPFHVEWDVRGDGAFCAAPPLFHPPPALCISTSFISVPSRTSTYCVACVKSQLRPTFKLRWKEWTEELNRFSTWPRSFHQETLILPAGPCTALRSLCFTHHIIYILCFLKAGRRRVHRWPQGCNKTLCARFNLRVHQLSIDLDSFHSHFLC